MLELDDDSVVWVGDVDFILAVPTDLDRVGEGLRNDDSLVCFCSQFVFNARYLNKLVKFHHLTINFKIGFYVFPHLFIIKIIH